MSKQIICRPERENPQGRNAVYVASPFAVEAETDWTLLPTHRRSGQR